MYMYIYIDIYLFTCICMYIDTYIHIYIYIYTYFFILVDWQWMILRYTSVDQIFAPAGPFSALNEKLLAALMAPCASMLLS